MPSQTNNNGNLASKAPGCSVTNVGDYCFLNKTGLNLEITLWSSPDMKTRLSQRFTCTIQPDQEQCFFSVPAGPAKYQIQTGISINGYGTDSPVKNRNYFAEGELYMDACQTKFFTIK